MTTIRIGTRKSQLALWQAEFVRNQLRVFHPGLAVELVTMNTEGDRILDRTLAKIGGKGLFTQELEQGLTERRIDLAVHSMKDVTVSLPEGLHIASICEREDPRDAFVSNTYADLASLPPGARVGTASLRRQSQLRNAYPQLHLSDLRGNVNTRLARLDAGEFDAIILAAAGLRRLDFGARIRAYLDIDSSLPAVGQGAVGIECRADDSAINRLIAPLNHAPTHLCLRAERAMNAHLQGGCQVPIGGFAELHAEVLHMRGFVGAPDGSRVLRAEMRGSVQQAERIGISVASELLAQGAQELLDAVYGRT